MQTDHPNNRQPLLGPEQYSKSKMNENLENDHK